MSNVYNDLICIELMVLCSVFEFIHDQVMGMEPGVPYVFNIVNFEKKGSQFNAGMQPVVFSVKEAELTEQGGWYRSGEDVAYYANQFRFMDVSCIHICLSIYCNSVQYGP